MFKHRSYFDATAPDIVIKSLFDKYDTDGSETLQVTELRKLLQDDLGLLPAEAHAYILLIDKDASGSVSFDEFKTWLKSGEKLNSLKNKSRFGAMQKAVDIFKLYDRDGSGALNRSEFSLLHADVGGQPQGLASAINELDKDGNGKISFYEFLKWLNWVDLGTF